MKLSFKISNSLILVLILAFISCSSFGQVDKKLLIGKWLFVTFTLPTKSTINDEYIWENNKKYKDLTYIITPNEFEMQKKNGGKNWNKKVLYKLVENKYIQLSVGQRMRIDYLDANTLKIFVEGSAPTGIFKRIK